MLDFIGLFGGFYESLAVHCVNLWADVIDGADGGKEAVEQFAGLDILFLTVVGIIGGMDKTGGFARLAEPCVYGVCIKVQLPGRGLYLKQVVAGLVFFLGMRHYLSVLISVELLFIGLAVKSGRQGVNQDVCHSRFIDMGTQYYQIAYGSGHGNIEKIQIVNGLQTCFLFEFIVEYRVCQLAAESYGQQGHAFERIHFGGGPDTVAVTGVNDFPVAVGYDDGVKLQSL